MRTTKVTFPDVLLLTLVSPVLGANCYVVAREGSAQCVVVDPGIAVDDQLGAAFAEHGLNPVAALVTHGHLDHTLSLAPLCRRHEIPVYVHAADRYRLGDPLGTLGAELAPAFAGMLEGWAVPADVRTVDDGDRLRLADLDIEVIGVPGHTEGSTFYDVHAPDGAADLCFTGDVLFAGTVGRTDLPGGDPDLMAASLAGIALPAREDRFPDDTTVLPGHGAASTFARERATNPFLLALT